MPSNSNTNRTPQHSSRPASPAPARPAANEDVLVEQESEAEQEQELTEDASMPSYEELLAAYRAQVSGAAGVDLTTKATVRTPTASVQAQAPKPADPYDEDDFVTVLLPHIVRKVIAGEEPKSHRVFVSGDAAPRAVDDGVGGTRLVPGATVTVEFRAGVARNVRYGIAKRWKKTVQFKDQSDPGKTAIKIVPNDTPETLFAKLCGVQPMQPQKQAAMLLASDLDAVLGEFSTEQLALFAQALQRRAASAQEEQRRADIFSTASVTRG